METSLLDLTLAGLDGRELHLSVPDCTLVSDLLRLVELELPPKPGCVLRLSLGGAELSPDATLREQGLKTHADLMFTYTRTCLLKAWNVLNGCETDSSGQALEGITQLLWDGLGNQHTPCRLPSTLQSLTFGQEFDHRLHGITLPGRLRSLTFGDAFNQSLHGVILPSSLQNLTFQPALGDSAIRPAEPLLWEPVQPKFAGRHFSWQLAKPHFRLPF